MLCTECERLLAAFARTAEAYYVTVEALARRMENADTAEYIALKQAMDHAQLNSVLAHVELKQHQQGHLPGEN